MFERFYAVASRTSNLQSIVGPTESSLANIVEIFPKKSSAHYTCLIWLVTVVKCLLTFLKHITE